MPLVASALLTAVTTPAGAQTKGEAVASAPTAPLALQPVPPAKSYVLVDLNTGNVLAAYHEHVALRPGSLTKVLTALIAVTYLGRAATVPGTKQSWDVYPDKVGIEPGVAWPLDEVLQSLLVMSANDAAYALAQRISGSLQAFGAVMSLSAAQIGMTDHYVLHDPAGLDGTEGVDGGNYISARDLAIAGRDLLRVPLLARIVKEQAYTFVDPTGARHWLGSANYDFLTEEPGAIGVKTGFTDRAGFCVMGAATKHGRSMLAVVMDGYNSDQTAMDLLNQGFQTPVKDEPTNDRLPAFALPSPPRASHASEQAKTLEGQPGGQLVGHALSPMSAAQHATSHAGTRNGAGTSHSATPRSKQRGAPAPKAALSATGTPALGPAISRGGLTAVVRTLPGTVLLLSSATACLIGLAEYLKLSRLRRAQPLSMAPVGRAMTWVTTLGGSRRHRDDLVASYSRHERGEERRFGS